LGLVLSEKEEKLLVRKATLNLRRKYGRTKQINVVERDAFIPKNLEKEIKESILKKKSILATDIALKYDIRISTAKLLLKQYEEEGIIKLLDPSLKLKIYIPKS
jgi:ribosomal protein S25